MIVNSEGPTDARIMLVGEAPGCFAEDVEVLTPNGWVWLSTISEDDQVAQYNEGVIEFVTPTAIINEQYTGSVIRLTGSIEALVTNNHRIPVYNKYHNKYLIEVAESLRNKYPEQSILLSGSKKDGIDLGENLIRLLVAVQADGSYEPTGIRFEFAKERKAIRLLMLLTNVGASYRIGERNNRETFRFTLPKKDPIYWFIEHMIPDKIFSWNLLALNRKGIDIFFDELKYWDGSVDSRNSNWTYFEYSSSIQKNIDIVQALAHLSDRKAIARDHSRAVRILVTLKNKTSITTVTKTAEQFSGSVYCLTVPSGLFVVRSHNKIFITGNSEEDQCGRPFVGPAGKILDNLLSQAGIARYQCLVTNVARERPPANKISYFFEDSKCTLPKPRLRGWIEQLKQEIQMYSPNVIVALGATALWALTGEKKISDFRGYILPCRLVPNKKVLPTFHPQAVGYEWKFFFPTVLDLRKALRHSKTPSFCYPEQTLFPNQTPKQFIAYMEELINSPQYDKLSIDVETVQPGSHIEELGIAHSPTHGASIFLLKGRTAAMCENDELKLWQTFAQLVKCKKVIMHNGAYDTGVIWYNNHILVENLWMDTLIAAHVCWPEMSRDLGFLGSLCLEVPPWKNGSAKTEIYNPADAANTFGIAEVLDKELDRQQVRPTFDFEMSLIPVSLMMQLQGIWVDKNKQEELLKYWEEKRTEQENMLDLALGKKVNFKSSKQMQQLLYVDLGLPPQYKRRKSVDEPRTMTTDANALRTLARLVPDNKIFNMILDYKKADTLINNFLSTELSPEDKVHTSYNITGAASDDEEDTKKTKRSFGRWSSSASIIIPYGSGNLQNIPPEARKMYRAPKGWKIIEADYAQAEAVVMAHLISDRKLIKMFKDSFGLSKTEKKAYDIHKMTIADMLGIPLDQVTPEQRQAGKTIRHATNYSAGPQVLANRLGVKLSAAKTLIELYHRANPLLRIWYSRIQDELKRTRVLTNLFGRKHRFLDRWGDSLFRSAYSYIPQSTVGDLLNKAIRRLYDEVLHVPYELTILLQLHDAMYVMVEEENVMPTVRLMRKCMTIPLLYNYEEFTIDTDFKVKDSWAEGIELDIDWRNANDTD